MDIHTLHWMAVGDITDAAKLRIKNVSGFVRKFDAGPTPLYLVGIPCVLIPGYGRGNTEVRYRTWTRSQEVVVEIPSVRLKLSWVSVGNILPFEASAADTTLDVWQEET